jgi:hypothetical protein
MSKFDTQIHVEEIMNNNYDACEVYEAELEARYQEEKMQLIDDMYDTWHEGDEDEDLNDWYDNKYITPDMIDDMYDMMADMYHSGE